MKRALRILFYLMLFSIIATIFFGLIWMYDNGKRTAADPNLMGEWIALGILGMLVYWCYAGVFLMIVAVMKGMDLAKSFFNLFMLFVIGLVGVLPTIMIAVYFLIQTPNPFKQYEQVPDKKELMAPYQQDSK